MLREECKLLMEKKVENIKKILQEKPEYRETLFRRGYLITDRKIDNTDEYPFYDNWKVHKIKTFNVYVHKDQDFYEFTDDKLSIIMIGHAYNPFDMKYDENELLKDALDAYKKNKETFFDKISEFTGIHLIVVFENDKLIAVQDCAGIKSCYFGIINSKKYITSHPQLVADICNLEMDEFVKKLVSLKCYNIGNRYLPGNITPYKELKRLGGNTYTQCIKNFKINRFYPTKEHFEVKNEKQYKECINKIAILMNKNIELASKKWNNCAISLSGGMDSKTTLATANGLYDKFKYFSFISKDSEAIDSNAAHEICNSLKLKHEIYNIPSSNEEVKDFEILKKIINHNTSYFMNLPNHELRKYIYLYRLNGYDIELKSWVSEIARVFIERKYGMKMPQKLNERQFNIFQTRYFMCPKVMHKADMYYYEFMKEIELREPIYNYEHADLFYWESRLGAWGTSVISSLDIAHKITMPFNNRKLIEVYLYFQHKDRKNDRVHKDVIEYSNKKIANMNIEIANKYFHSYRIIMERVYYYVRTIFYKKNRGK
ncbi:MAG: 7-cyano-7-deazaguanine synthase [Clostridia bacterium]|nr:7-cyano-7-deazaguanine synthase [Clostridia bacterium]